MCPLASTASNNMIARIPTGKTFVFWQPARKYTQSYHDYASFCPAKYHFYSVLSTKGALNVNIGHIVYSGVTRAAVSQEPAVLWEHCGCCKIRRVGFAITTTNICRFSYYSFSQYNFIQKEIFHRGKKGLSMKFIISIMISFQTKL